MHGGQFQIHLGSSKFALKWLVFREEKEPRRFIGIMKEVFTEKFSV